MNGVVPPEVIFDRYFRNKIPFEDRSRYQGKADISLVEDGATRDLLESIQSSINDAYAGQAARILTRGKNPTLHFDYVHSGLLNAIAFQDEDCAFVGLTLPLFNEVGEICALLANSEFVTDVFRTGTWAIHERRQFFTALFAAQLQFIACHELGHHFHGHCSGNQGLLFTWEEFTEGAAGVGLANQAKELDADGFAMHMIAKNFVSGSPRSKLLELLGLPTDEVEDVGLLALLILAAGSFFFRRQQEFASEKIASLTHPPAAVRLHFVTQELVAWLETNRSSSAPLITGSRFADLMGAAANALSTSTSSVPWQQQTEFLISQPGRDYLTLLSEARSMLRHAMADRRWQLESDQESGH